MTDFVITTENAADLPEEFIQENEIGILSLYYTIDGVTYGPDGERLDVEEFYAKMRAGALPKTQQVNPDQAIQKFRSYLEQGKDILHLALTSAVSGSYNSAKMAAQELMEEFPERTITVIDTLVGTLAEGMVVDKVAQMRKAGRTLAEAARWLDAYFSGREPDFLPPLRPRGSPFQLAVWRKLLEIPYGQTTTYGAIARAVASDEGRASVPAQAVGGAVGRNPLSVFIPCHRVVGASGSLTGYAGGLDRKIALLELERCNTTRLPRPAKGAEL